MQSEFNRSIAVIILLLLCSATLGSIPIASSQIANETGGKLLMELELVPGFEGDKLELASEEISSSNAKICPTNNCQFGLLGSIGPNSETIQPGLEPNSDGTGYTFEGKLHVTINNAQGVSTGSASYFLDFDLNKEGTEDDESTENLRGTLTSTDESSQAQTEYDVEGALITGPNIEQGLVMGPITLNLTAQEK